MSHDPAAHATPHLALQLPLAGIQVIEASAGTGKTYALAGLYVRLIVERRLQVRQILVVTYTRAAADELRERLRERLVLCARLSANDDGKDASAEAQFCRDVLARAKDEGAAVLNRRLALAALSLDEAQIGTVHGFCQRVLREHAWLGGVAPLAGELLEREDELIDSLVRDLWRERAASADETGWQALRGIACSAEGLARILRALRDQHVTLQPQPARSAAALRAQLTDTSADRVLADLAAQWQAQGEAAFAALLAHLDGKHIKANIYKPDSVRQDAANFAAAFAQAQRPDRSRLERYAQSRINAPQALSKNGRALPMQAFFGAVEAACSALDEIAAAQTELGLHLLAECTAELRERLARRKRAARVYGYDDLIAGLADALAGAHGARLAAALREQFPAALIDECQDSAAREFDVFFAIYPPHAGARHLLALVGDPKQAIYRFKGGDVDAYLAARERADAQHTLAANYRSAPGLLAAIETLYAHAGAAPFVDPRIHFERVTAESGARDTDAQIDGVAAPPLTIWLAPKLTRKQDAAEYLAAGCAAEITRLLDLARQGRASLEQKQRDGARRRERLAARDIAVLVADHKQAATMQRALAANGVRCVVVSRASVYASVEAADLRDLLRALESRDPARLRGALSTRLFGLGLDQLKALHDDSALWNRHLAQLLQWREVWISRGILALVEQIGQARAAAWLADASGERRLTNLLHLGELLQRAAQRLDSARALSDYLGQRVALAAATAASAEDEQLRLESDADRVHICTLHKSKGLEYPFVFLPFVALRRGSKKELPRLYRYRERQAQTEIAHLCASGADDGVAEAADSRENLAEALRLLYVGITRAQYACYLAWGDLGSAGEPSAFEYLLRGGDMPAAFAARKKSADDQATPADDVVVRITALVEAAQGRMVSMSLPEASSLRVDAVNAAVLAPARTMHRRVREARGLHSFTSLSADKARVPVVPVGGEDEDVSASIAVSAPDLPRFARGAAFGTAFHEILEHTRFDTWLDAPPADEATRIDSILARHGLLGQGAEDAHLRRILYELIAATVNTPLPFGARLADLAGPEYRAEMPFHFAIADSQAPQLLDLLQRFGYLQARSRFALDGGHLSGLLTGVLDLVVLREGRWWVIDYKTNVLDLTTQEGSTAFSPYAPARLKAAVAASEYDLQYLIYLTALHRWLGARYGAAYDYARDIGGALYLFVRGLDAAGNGVHVDKPPLQLIEAIDRLLAAPLTDAA